jgi:hypothetical protein
MAELSFDSKTTRLDRTTPTTHIREIVDTLFGHSDVLDQHLLPAISKSFSISSEPLANYESFINLCEKHVNEWDYEKKGQFLSGHPEIGAPKVSGLSAKEQGTAQVDPATLQRCVPSQASHCDLIATDKIGYRSRMRNIGSYTPVSFTSHSSMDAVERQ